MATRETAEQDERTIRRAFEHLLAGRLDRREFMRITARLGVSAAVAASMAGGRHRSASVRRRTPSEDRRWAESVGVVDWKILQPELLEAWKMKDEHG